MFDVGVACHMFLPNFVRIDEVFKSRTGAQHDLICLHFLID